MQAVCVIESNERSLIDGIFWLLRFLKACNPERSSRKWRLLRQAMLDNNIVLRLRRCLYAEVELYSEVMEIPDTVRMSGLVLVYTGCAICRVCLGCFLVIVVIGCVLFSSGREQCLEACECLKLANIMLRVSAF